jgi:hypothetical protein
MDDMSAFETGNKLTHGPNGEPLTRTSLTTWSQHTLDLADINPDAIWLDDIARGLSQHVRWAGQGEHWLSVAQHSVMTLRVVEGQAAAENWTPTRTLKCQALMHDAHEYIIGDLSGGLKYLLRDSVLKDLIFNLQMAIEYAIGYDGTALPGYSEAIKKAEDFLVPIEYDYLFKGREDHHVEGSWCRDIAMSIFLSEAERLGLGRGGPDGD